jgi:hypothetical protein
MIPSIHTIYAGKARILLSIAKLENLARNTRQKDYADWESQIWAENLCRAGGDDDRNFVRFNSKMFIGDSLAQVVGFANPFILTLIGNTRLHGFADATFSVVPHGFLQLLIIMMYFSTYDLYVPVYYILMSVSIPIFFILMFCFLTSFFLSSQILCKIFYFKYHIYHFTSFVEQEAKNLSLRSVTSCAGYRF